jgi:hypothetical protein
VVLSHLHSLSPPYSFLLAPPVTTGPDPALFSARELEAPRFDLHRPDPALPSAALESGFESDPGPQQAWGQNAFGRRRRLQPPPVRARVLGEWMSAAESLNVVWTSSAESAMCRRRAQRGCPERTPSARAGTRDLQFSPGTDVGAAISRHLNAIVSCEFRLSRKIRCNTRRRFPSGVITKISC